MIIARRAGARSCAPVFWCCYSVAGALPAAVSVPAPLGKPPKAKKTTASTSTKAAEAITELIDATTKIKSKKVKKATSKKRSREEPVAFCVNTSESAINSKKEMGVNSDAANVKPTTHAVAVQTTCSHSMVENSVSATNGLALSEDVRGSADHYHFSKEEFMEMFMTMLPTLVDALKEPLLHHLQREINKRTPAKATREPCSEAAAVQDPLFKQFREVSVVGSDMHSSLSSHPFFRLNLTDNDQCIWGEKLSDFFKLS